MYPMLFYLYPVHIYYLQTGNMVITCCYILYIFYEDDECGGFLLTIKIFADIVWKFHIYLQISLKIF